MVDTQRIETNLRKDLDQIVGYIQQVETRLNQLEAGLAGATQTNTSDIRQLKSTVAHIAGIAAKLDKPGTTTP